MRVHSAIIVATAAVAIGFGALTMIEVRFGNHREWAHALIAGAGSALFMGVVLGAYQTWRFWRERKGRAA